MRLDDWFRLLQYMTLGAAGVCLVYGDAVFVPILPLCLGPFFVLLAVAFFAEGKWTLPDWGANVLGVGIAAVSLWWAVRASTGENALVSPSDFPAAFIPFV